MTALVPPEPTVVSEWGRAEVTCSAEIAAVVHRDRHVRISPLGGSRYEIQAQHKVGTLRYGDLHLRIRPKVEVGRLLHLAMRSELGSGWQETDSWLDEVDDPLSAVVHALVRAAEHALQPSPMQGYVHREVSESRIRGRLDFGRQIQLRAGLLLPAEISYDEFEIDIIENRVLKASLLLAEGRAAELTAALRSRLLHIRFQLDGVEPWRVGVPVPPLQFGRRNERYRTAIALAKLVLDGRSLEFLDDRAHGASGFLFDMNRIYEGFLTSVLADSLERIGGRVRAQAKLSLDEEGNVELRPDISWWLGDRCLAVIDAKYKRTDDTSFPNADAYQMLAYCTTLGLRRGWLIYADLDGSTGGTTTVCRSGVEIVVRALTLDGTIDEVDARAYQLAHEIEE